MIVHLFPDKQEQQSRLIGISVVFTLGCASAFCLSVLSRLMFIPYPADESSRECSGALLTLAHWRWIFRFSACISAVGASVGWLLLPKAIRAKQAGSISRNTAAWKVIKRLDVVGVVLVMGALLLFSLALTSKSFSAQPDHERQVIVHPLPGATVHGWSSPHFIVPIILAALLFPSFCYWEARQDVRYAMLPVAIMKERKFLVVCFTGCVTPLSRLRAEVLIRFRQSLRGDVVLHDSYAFTKYCSRSSADRRQLILR